MIPEGRSPEGIVGSGTIGPQLTQTNSARRKTQPEELHPRQRILVMSLHPFKTNRGIQPVSLTTISAIIQHPTPAAP
jgi:hypothetical protein